jgi:ABC-type transport system involved in multi-copper enzyme maturation permease subunit
MIVLVGAEVTIVVLSALNMSATAVSREREDGTLDLILTTPIQPGPYIAGKLRGLVMYLLPMLLVPVVTMLLLAIYCLIVGDKAGIVTPVGSGTLTIPVMSIFSALAMLFLFPPFVAFAVMIGLQWSIRSKGTISSVIAAVMVLLAVVGVIGLCGMASGQGIPYLGAVISASSPFNLIFASFMPNEAIPETIDEAGSNFGPSLFFGALISGVIYGAIVFGMHASMKKSFMMTVRRLAGTR